jgi:hypothetical protein
MECRNCKYWGGKPDAARHALRDCRRYAPRPGDRHGWPRTNPDDWCGEFQHKVDVSVMIEPEA